MTVDRLRVDRSAAVYSVTWTPAADAMPTAETLERFIALVEQNAHVEAVEGFYTADASMQENQAAPRIGRDAVIAGWVSGLPAPSPERSTPASLRRERIPGAELLPSTFTVNRRRPTCQ